MNIKRPPIVVVMGHIDHGKSTLLDYIRKSNVVAGEVGGITQHMGAYQAEHVGEDGKKHLMTFLDTPGHEAFCTIRERGAKAADVAILVVSAEDGVKPQTLDALKAIKEQRIPFVVAINKIDKPNANIDRAKTSLGENEIYVEGWGGDIPCVAISALNGTGVKELLDIVLLVAELADLNTDPNKSAEGTVVESKLDTRKGVSATLLIKDGTLTLETGTYVVAGDSITPVRYIENFLGQKIESATASMPVHIIGWNKVPVCGTNFVMVENKKIAEKMAEEYIEKSKSKKSTAKTHSTKSKTVESKDSLAAKKDDGPVILPLIIKADTIGSLDGVKYELAKIKHDKVQLKIVSEGIGEINENDVKTALGDPNILIIGFNSEPDKKTANIIERSTIPIKYKNFNIIYELSQYVKDQLLALVPKEYEEITIGQAKILALFSKEKDRQVVGGKVESGALGVGNEVKIMRRSNEVARGRIRELQSKKQRAQEVLEGFEFGAMIEAKLEIAVGDRIEAVETKEKVV